MIMKDGQLVELPPEILAQFWKLTVAKLLDLTVTTALSFQSYSSVPPSYVLHSAYAAYASN